MSVNTFKNKESGQVVVTDATVVTALGNNLASLVAPATFSLMEAK